MCQFCGKEWKRPKGDCPDNWKCPDCGDDVSPCCGAAITNSICDDSECDLCQLGWIETCVECGTYCHCGGCV
jgi:hypothetical protein